MTFITARTLTGPMRAEGLPTAKRTPYLRRTAGVPAGVALVRRIKPDFTRARLPTARMTPVGFLVVVLAAVWLLPTKAESQSSQRTAPVAPPNTPAVPSQDLSGQVVDPNGRPVAGAQVALCTKDKGVEISGARLMPSTVVGITSEIVTTDVEGRFAFRTVPEEFVLLASHETGFVWVDKRHFTPVKALQLQRWAQIQGTLHFGRELGADQSMSLSFNAPRNYEDAIWWRPVVTTDANGRFVFRQVIPGSLQLDRPDRRSDGSGRQTWSSSKPFPVKPGETLAIAVGGSGRTVVGKLILPTGFSNPSALPESSGSLDPAGVEADAFVVGRVRWSYRSSINKDGTFHAEDVVPGRYVLRITFPSPESSTGFSVVYHAALEVPALARGYSDTPLDLGIVMLAEGYGANSLPVSSMLVETASQSPQPAGPTTPPRELSGRVVDPAGRPVAGAQVGLNTGAQVLLHNGVLELDKHCPKGEWIVATNADGRFHLENKLPDPFYLLVAHEAGFALVMGNESKANGEIRLQRWGRVEGQLAQGRGGPDHRLWMKRLPTPVVDWLRRAFCHDTPYGPDGRFVFEKVPPGWFEVGYLVPIGDDSSGFTSRTPVLVKAGETVKVKVGGEGRPVVGRFAPPASYGRTIYFGNGLRALRGQEKIEGPQLTLREWEEQHPPGNPYSFSAAFFQPRVADYAITTADNQPQTPYWDSWGRDESEPSDTSEPLFSDAAWSDGNWRSYAFRINSDGSFRIEDVRPCTYELAVDLQKRNLTEADSSHEPFARYRGAVEVPPIAQAYTDQPLDLGTLTLDVHGVGAPTPLFESTTVDGKHIRLIDYRGKFVLLSFWSVELYSHSASELDCLKDLHKTYGDHGNLQIIGINQSDLLETIQKWVTQNKIEWPQIWSSEGWAQGIFGQYHVSHLSYSVLVDPEGRIVATDLQGQELTNTLRRALERSPASVPAPPGDKPVTNGAGQGRGGPAN